MRFLGPKTGKMALVYKKPPMGAVVYMSLYDVVSRRLGGFIHNLGYLKGVALQPSPVKLHPPLIDTLNIWNVPILSNGDILSGDDDIF